MFLKIENNVIIEDRRGYSPGVVENLRALLEGGVRAELDPRRGDCYDLQDHHRAYYIYISPVSGRVVLLATCLKSAEVRPGASAQRPPAFTTLSFGSMSLVP